MISPDFTQFHSTIAKELWNKKDLVRNLIGNTHWSTDGEHKESILRAIFNDKLPSTLVACKGFACLNAFSGNNDSKNSSSQLDIILRDNNYPTLLDVDGTVFINPPGVKGIIEVKTKIQNSTNSNNKQGIKHVIAKLSDNIEFIRKNGGMDCLAGLFVYDEGTTSKQSNSKDLLTTLLKTLQSECRNNPQRVINYVSIGPKWFVRFWPKSEREDKVPYGSDIQAWHLYELEISGNLALAQAYFINNFVVSLSPKILLDYQSSYFPLVGGKKRYRLKFIKLDDSKILEFSSEET